MQLTALPQFKRNASRFKEIVVVFFKYGLVDWLDTYEPDFIKKLFKRNQTDELDGVAYEARVRMALTELGTTFIKLGQIMSTREDIVRPALAKELSLLQSSTPADPPDRVIATFTDEIGSVPELVFSSFNPLAMASASIGQIHEACLMDGQPVVVKIQHQGIEQTVINDLDILMLLAELAEKLDERLLLYQPQKTLSEFRRSLLRELDFQRERKNLERIAKNFSQNEALHIAKTYPEFSSRRVLTQERLYGYSIADRKRLEDEGVDTLEMAKQGAQIFTDMIFRDGFFHADPHPGNIWALDDGKIGLLDFGMTGRLDDHGREDLEELLLAAVNRDSGRMTDYVLRLGNPTREIDRNALRSDLSEFVDEYVGDSLKDFDLEGALDGLTQIIREHRIILPANISLLLKVLIMLEGTSRMLDRDFNLVEQLKPYLEKNIRRKYSPERLLQRLRRSLRDWERLLDVLPGQLTQIVQQLRDGDFDVNLKHRRLDSTVNRLVHGILTAALFVGSCQILDQRIPPLVAGISVFGAAGCLVALFLMFQLFRAIRKTGDLDGR